MVCAIPSTPIGVQIAGPIKCAGMETSSTFAPSFLNSSADFFTLASEAASDSGRPKPSLTTPIFRSLTPPSSIFEYFTFFGVPYWRGS